MVRNDDELKAYLKNLRTGDYQKDNFDAFLKKINFIYDVPSIHIAGSNGKGSVGNYLNNIFHDKGYKVGYFFSPYYLDMKEMILINNNKIDLTYIDKIISNYDKYIRKYNLSEFELETFIAFNYFIDNDVDIAIIECGMGGEYDATNIFVPIISVITSISLEHTNFLGSSITEIALSKSGIIKDNIDVVIGELDDEANQVIYQEALKKHSKVIKYDPYYDEKIKDFGYYFSTLKYKDLYIPSLGTYSIIDALIAIKVVDHINNVFPVDETNIKNGLKITKINGRMSIINLCPLTIIDGAHNPEGINKLCESINKLNIENKQIHVIFAAFLDKNIQNMLSSLNFISHDIYLTTFDNPRARNKDDYFLYLDEYRYEDNPIDIYLKLKEQYPDDIILICGSLAFAFYMYDKLKEDN